MPRQSKQKPARRRAPHQIDLFAEGAQTIAQIPVWSALPMETQAALTSLLMQLILDHADKIRGNLLIGGGDDL
jgi:hypothetical protein